MTTLRAQQLRIDIRHRDRLIQLVDDMLAGPDYVSRVSLEVGRSRLCEERDSLWMDLTMEERTNQKYVL